MRTAWLACLALLQAQYRMYQADGDNSATVILPALAQD
jgi:hypothetical protein